MIDLDRAGLADELARNGIVVETEYPAGRQIIHGDAALAAAIAAAWVPPPSPVPETITQAQMRRWLFLRRAIRDADVRAIITGMPDPEREIATIEWEYSDRIHRHHPLVESLGAALGLDSASLDQAFREASEP